MIPAFVMPRKNRQDPFRDEDRPLEDEKSPESGEEPSRTARKNAVQELTRLGEELLALRRERLAALQLPERLRDAIDESKRLTSFGAKRRQAQFIGKLLRKLDPDSLASIRRELSRRQ